MGPKGSKPGGDRDASGRVIQDSRVPGDVFGNIRKRNVTSESFKVRNSGEFFGREGYIVILEPRN